MLRISEEVFRAMIAHAEQELPAEACGYLAGANGLVSNHYQMTNLDRSAEHFTMAPGEQFAAVGDMRARGLKLRAVYHSHPETPARPSLEDIRLAHDPDISYVIVSLAADEPVIRSFLIRRGEVTPEPIEIMVSLKRKRMKK
ncbi:MAG: M67 family metallopeptidase [Desulfobacterales bacterium]|nr:M67 family metallopeptidase [Desulfobacterales bacterium]